MNWPGCPNQPKIDFSCHKYVPRRICSLICVAFFLRVFLRVFLGFFLGLPGYFFFFGSCWLMYFAWNSITGGIWSATYHPHTSNIFHVWFICYSEYFSFRITIERAKKLGARCGHICECCTINLCLKLHNWSNLKRNILYTILLFPIYIFHVWFILNIFIPNNYWTNKKNCALEADIVASFLL